MRSWQEDLLHGIDKAQCEHELFANIASAAVVLGFDFCAYGFRMPLPVSNPRILMLNNYPLQWRRRYEEAGYLHDDPTVLHGRKSHSPLVWSDDLFDKAQALWEEARSFGLQVGWAQSSLDGMGVGGMLTLARSHEAITTTELDAKEHKMRWLVHIAHMALARALKAKMPEGSSRQYLTGRELEVLKWTADGKSSQDIADILSLSKNTVEFHVKNAVVKLQACNKTAAVVRAAMLGYLN